MRTHPFRRRRTKDGHPQVLAWVVQRGKPKTQVKNRTWGTRPGAERTFDLQCDFVLSDEPLTTRRKNTFVVEPLHLRIVAEPPIVETNPAGTRRN